MENKHKSEDIIKENGLLRDINNILTGTCSYGRCKIEKHVVGPDVIWIGINGDTSSIGQWIRYIWNHIHPELDDKHAIVQGYKWYTCINNDTSQNHWYFGFKLTNRGKERIVICGGATDYSGEGGRGKQIAEKFMELHCPNCFIITSDGHQLISLLTGGVF